MATRAAKPTADWKAAFRHSLARSVQLALSVALFAFTAFLALSLLSYSQTDPSLSTAAGDVIKNWMGAPGAYAADGVLTAFGLVGALLLPLTYVFARKLWRDAGDEAHDEEHWWRATGMLLLAMVLLATVVSLVSTPREWTLPASTGGMAGLLGEGALRAEIGRASCRERVSRSV